MLQDPADMGPLSFYILTITVSRKIVVCSLTRRTVKYDMKGRENLKFKSGM
jgi:hypothetical protein